MGILEVFLDYTQSMATHEEDIISLFAYMAQQPVETITDVESVTKLMFSLLSQYNQNDFCGNFLQMLHNLKNHDYILSTNNNAVFRIYVKDKFIFKLILLVSLKYKRCIFIESETPKEFIQNILQEIIEAIDIVKNQSLYLVRLMENILKKRHDVLTPDLSLLILKCMNKVSYSPLTGFKNWAHNVSRIVLRSLPLHTKKHLCNFYNLPIKGIDLNDILKCCEETDFSNSFDLINKKILRLFRNNTDSREGSFFYDSITSICTFDDFVEKIWPHYCDHFQQFDEGEFYQSFLKYWIPVTVKHYESQFYEFLQTKDVDYHLKGYTLLETRKKGFYKKPKYDSDTFGFLKYSKTSDIGLKINCTFIKKHELPDEFELQAVRFYLVHYSQSELSDDILKNLKQVFSQIFLASHISLGKSNDTNLDVYSDFLNFVCNFCLARVSDEVSAQILKVVWDVAAGSSSDLGTCFKVDRNNEYETGKNLYFGNLENCGFWNKTFRNPFLVNQIEDNIRKFKHCPKLLLVVKERYLEVINFDSLTDLSKLLKDVKESVCLQSSEKIKAYTDCILCYKKKNKEAFKDDIVNLCEIFNNNIDCFDPQSLFTCVLIFDMLIVTMAYEDLNLGVLIKKSFQVLDKILDANLSTALDTKNSKVLESLINNVIECLSVSKSHWSEFNKEDLLAHLCKIIQLSNMMRPVSLAANLIISLGSHMEDDDKIVKVKLLYRTLDSLYHNKQSGKIRRNPESRLVIHALCLSDKNQTKPFLVSSLNFMLQVLANPLSSDYTLSSTLHSLEVLVSDNSIHQYTLPFMVDLIKHCIRLFNKPSWIVRNADLQLLKSLIERFLGVLLDDNVRPKTIEDLFVLFPELISHFYEILSARTLTDSAVVVLLFFSESQIKNDFFAQKSLGSELTKFRTLFLQIVKNYSNNVGLLAIKALTSLCPNSEIPKTISDIVDYIQRNFPQMNKNVFSSFSKLLQGLYHKYETSLDRSDVDVINHAANSLATFLKPYDCFYFNLISLKLYTVEELTDKVVAYLSNDIGYRERIWLNNYIPVVIMGIDFANLGVMLNRIFACCVPEFLQIQILSALVERSSDRKFPFNEIINILTLKLTTLSDRDNFLIMTYSKSILLLSDFTLELHVVNDVILTIRQDFKTNSIYKMFVYILVLANCDCRCDDDDLFVKKSIRKYIEYVGEDDEILLDLSTTIVHLFKVVSINGRYDVIKLIFYLLLNEPTSFEMCKFMSWLSNSHSSSVLISAVNLLKFDNLTKYLGGKELASKLLGEFYSHVDDLPDDLEESDTYYLIEKEFPLSKQCVKAIIVQSLSESNGENVSCT